MARRPILSQCQDDVVSTKIEDEVEEEEEEEEREEEEEEEEEEEYGADEEGEQETATEEDGRPRGTSIDQQGEREQLLPPSSSSLSSSSPSPSPSPALAPSTSAMLTAVEAVMDEIGFGPFQLMLLVYAGMAWFADAAEMILLSYLGPGARCEWGLTPEQESLITSCVFFGMLCGCYCWGVVADIKGRKLGFVAAAVSTLVAGLLSAASPSYVWLLVTRGIAGFGIGGGGVVFSLVLEFAPVRGRGFWLVTISLAWTFGSILEALLAWLVMPTMTWRILAVLSTPPLIFLCVFYSLLPESPRFLVINGRLEEARAVIQRVAKTNGRKIDLSRVLPLSTSASPPTSPSPSPPSSSCSSSLLSSAMPQPCHHTHVVSRDRPTTPAHQPYYHLTHDDGFRDRLTPPPPPPPPPNQPYYHHTHDDGFRDRLTPPPPPNQLYHHTHDDVSRNRPTRPHQPYYHHTDDDDDDGFRDRLAPHQPYYHRTHDDGSRDRLTPPPVPRSSSLTLRSDPESAGKILTMAAAAGGNQIRTRAAIATARMTTATATTRTTKKTRKKQAKAKEWKMTSAAAAAAAPRSSEGGGRGFCKTHSQLTPLSVLQTLFTMDLRRSTLLLWFVSFANAFTYYGLVLMATEFSSASHCSSRQWPNLASIASSTSNRGLDWGGALRQVVVPAAIPSAAQMGHGRRSDLIASSPDASCTSDNRPVLHVSDYASVLIACVAECPGLLLALAMVDWIGRKATMFYLLIACAVFTAPLLYVQSPTWVPVLLFGARGSVTGSFAVLWAYAPELYPTVVRSTGIGMTNAMGRVGGLLCPFVAVALMRECHVQVAICLMVIVPTLAAIACTFFSKETMGMHLDSGPGQGTEIAVVIRQNDEEKGRPRCKTVKHYTSS